MSSLFDDLLQPLGDKQRDALVTAWAALEYGSEPASEVDLSALRDAALRRLLEQMLRRTGRTLVRGCPRKADGSSHRSQVPIFVRYASVDTAT
jgi:hypothetical protein